MENEDIVKGLCHLSQLDIDAVHAYEQALKNIDIPNVITELQNFKNDHIAHINNLSALIRKYGGTPPERTQDFTGYIIQGMTAIRSMIGNVGALKAMESNEELTNAKYKEALEQGFPPEVRELIQTNYHDEQHHLEFIRASLKKLSAE